MSDDRAFIRRALISVSDKTAVVELGKRLAAGGIEILSTGGTAAALSAAGVPVIDVADHTGFPEMMDGRLKTLHPKVHGGLLAVRGNEEHEAAAQAHGISAIDLLIVNLYPFESTVASDAPYDSCVENIDIGGPAMIRAAAKNHASVTVIVDPADYDALSAELAAHDGATTRAFRKRMAAKAFARTAAYDGAISNWLGAEAEGLTGADRQFPPRLTLQVERVAKLRYGENPHQPAAFYRDGTITPGSIACACQVCGKELSFNNIADADAALECVKAFDKETACVIVKHTNPCGVAIAPTQCEAYERAFATDPESAFGGIIAFNTDLEVATAAAILERQFVEVIIAPNANAEAIATIGQRKNVRLLLTGALAAAASASLDLKKVNGGMLLQGADNILSEHLTVVTKRAPSSAEMADLIFAMKVAKFVKSNAIVFARDGRTIGIGAGQMSRVNSTRIAVDKARAAALEIKGSVVASDAFFPFADGLIHLAEAGATAVIQPGGSMRDREVIAAADDRGVAMVFSGLRHFRH